MSLGTSGALLNFRFVDPATASQLHRFYVELHAELAQIEGELSAIAARAAHVEVTTGSQAE
eukprot:12378565-Alexandrium_andersonii.AAC.1